MEDHFELFISVLTWILMIGLIFYRQQKRASMTCGLLIMYVVVFALNHLFGACIYLLPWYTSPLYNRQFVEAGFQESTYGLAAFTIGSLLIAPYLMRLAGLPKPKRIKREPEFRLATVYLIMGASFYVILRPLLIGTPTVTALVSTGYMIVVVGLCLKVWKARIEGNRKRMLFWLLMALLFPFTTVFTQGFLGYGTVALISVLAFVAYFYRPRWQIVLLTILAAYIGLSVYVVYMRDRSDIREVVWKNESYATRWDQLTKTFSSMELFNIYNNDHLYRIDDRLNQNHLVGASIYYIDSKYAEFANGETVKDAFLSLVPRIIWSDKTIFAGSGGLVSSYTGMKFAEGTSVGIGQVMEFYINFGTLGVIIGFLIFGIILAFIDSGASLCLLEGNLQGFALWFLVGIAFLQPIGSLVEITSSAASSMLVAFVINKGLLERLQGREVKKKESKEPSVVPITNV